MLDILRKSRGTAIAATDDELMVGVKELATKEGIFAAPEGGAALVAYKKLMDSGFFSKDERVVMFNTGSGYKYIDLIAKYWGVGPFARNLPSSRSMGGIIGPS